MRYLLLALSMLFSAAASAATYVSIGINLPVYPELVRVPNYPVYYAPRVNANIFFYDGLYWVYTDDRWYASTWYNGPWEVVDPYSVPVYVLRVPVRYYRYRPAYFSSWSLDASPRWGEYWGASWEQRRSGWDRWNRSSVPAAAPLPVYQRQYSGDRYPRVEQQQVILTQQYRYQPRDTMVRQVYRQQVVQTSVAPAQKRQVTQSAAATQSSPQFAPGQVKSQQGAQSAKEFAPGQVKKQQNAQSAKEFAPGQVRKQQATQTTQTTAMAPVQPAPQQIAPTPRPNENARGRGKGKGHDDDEGQGQQGQGQGQGRGEGQGKGHGKGRGKD